MRSPASDPASLPHEFIELVRRQAPHWSSTGVPPGLLERLGSTGFLSERWRHGRQQGLRSALSLIDALAPLDGGVALVVSLHMEVFLATLRRFPGNTLAAATFTDGLVGHAVGALALTEDDGGSNPAAVRTRATKLDGAGWHLTGQKRYISGLGQATHCLLLADAHDGERSGPTLFLLALRREGVRRVGTYPKLGTRSVGAWRLELDVEVSAHSRLGPVGGGMACVLPGLRYERLSVARAVTSGARYSLGLSTAYLRRRMDASGRLFDRSSLTHVVASCWVRLEAAEAMIERVISRDVEGTVNDADYAAVKHYCATTATEVADLALQMMGGRGYTEAFPHERIWRDARLGRIGAGTDQMMLEIIARSLDRASTFDQELIRLMENDITVDGVDGHG